MIPPNQSERPALRAFAFRRPPAEASRPATRPAFGDGPRTAGASGAGGDIDGLPAGAGPHGRTLTPTPGNEGGGIGGQQGQLGGGSATGAQDSITLGQLKAHNAAQEKMKAQVFDYHYDDTDNTMREIEEFYSYVEMPLLDKVPPRFKASFGDAHWTKASSLKRRDYIQGQLEYIESPLMDLRRDAQGMLLYLVQGIYGEVLSPEEQLHWITENVKTIRSCDGVAILMQGLRDSMRRYNAISESVNDKPGSSTGPGPSLTPTEPGSEQAAELSDMLGILYMMVEVSRADPTFADELVLPTTSLPVMLFQMVAALKDRLPRGFPVKKMLLLLWKVLLACWGGMREVTQVKALARELAGLDVDKNVFTKATPVDIVSFRRDISMKYPTFLPSSPKQVLTAVTNEKLAEGIKPIPARSNFHATEQPGSSPTSNPAHTGPGASQPLPGTPAPSPPPSPAAGPQNVRIKKMQFQTDPTRPFVFPFSRSVVNGSSTLVPFAISEADKLYHQHAYVSLGLYQMWETREELLREERGLGKSGMFGFGNLKLDDEDEYEEAWGAMKLEWRFDEEARACLDRGDQEGAKRAQGNVESARRLQRVDLVYKKTLPIMQSCVIVLLKLLLATVTGPGGQNMAQQNTALPPGFQSPAQEQPPTEAQQAQLPPPPPPTTEEVDVARHREITSKALSAIFILMLKWFRAAHVLKFHYLGQLLFDSNCLLLVLKMFGLQDAFTAVSSKNELPALGFFRYCNQHFSPTPMSFTSPTNPVAPKSPKPTADTLGTAGKDGKDGKDAKGDSTPELITEYSWRNFFTAINFLKILQKMTKHRSHRTFMLNTYKSSAILKRMLKVNHPMFQLQALKLIKSQMPWCGRKWRQTNMKVITSIYLNCRPELRDEWLSGQDQENELEDALPQEHALRTLIAFHNKQYMPSAPAHISPTVQEPLHKRSDSTNATTLEDPALLQHVPLAGPGRRRSSAIEDVFPPRHAMAESLPYNPDGAIEFWLHEYEDVLGEVFGEEEDQWEEYGVSGSPQTDRFERRGSGGVPGPADRDDVAWNRLGEIMRAKGAEDEDISDSESVVSIGELGEDARFPGSGGIEEEETIAQMEENERVGSPMGRPRRKSKAGENTWENLSADTFAQLPKSPVERRRSSSSGSPFRPVGLSAAAGGLMNIGLQDVFTDEEEEGNLPGPMPIERDTPDERDRDFGAVDEVEYVFGE